MSATGYTNTGNLGVTSPGPARTTYTTNYGGSNTGVGTYGGATYSTGGVRNTGGVVTTTTGAPGIATSGASYGSRGTYGTGQAYNVQQGI